VCLEIRDKDPCCTKCFSIAHKASDCTYISYISQGSALVKTGYTTVHWQRLSKDHEYRGEDRISSDSREGAMGD
jgi:hypothetical protein